MRSLARIAEEWGGKLQPREDAGFPRFPRTGQQAPFTHYDLAISWKAKTIYYDPEEVEWMDVVHEMGHVFGCRVPPSRSDEAKFLGFEIALVKKIGAPMRGFWDGHADYMLDTYPDDRFPLPVRPGELKHRTPAERKKIVKWAYAIARDYGTIDARGMPVPCR